MWSLTRETTGLSAIYNDLIQVASLLRRIWAMSLRSLTNFIDLGPSLSVSQPDWSGITNRACPGVPSPLVQVLKEFQAFSGEPFLSPIMPPLTWASWMPTTSVMVFRRSLSRSSRYAGICPDSYPVLNGTRRGHWPSGWGLLEHHHMANYDAEGRALLFIFVKDVAEKHGVTNLRDLNIDLIDENSHKKVRGQACDLSMSRTRPALRICLTWSHFLGPSISKESHEFPRPKLDAQSARVLILGIGLFWRRGLWCGCLSESWRSSRSGPSITTFIEVMPTGYLCAPHCRARAGQGHGRAPDHYQELDRSRRSSRQACSLRQEMSTIWMRSGARKTT